MNLRQSLLFGLLLASAGLLFGLLLTHAGAPPDDLAPRLWRFDAASASVWIALGLAVAGFVLVRSDTSLAALDRIPWGARSFSLGIYFAGVAIFVVLNDRARGGDYVRILTDIRSHVLLLKAEPLTPAIFFALSRVAWFARWHVPGLRHLELLTALQWSIAFVSGFGVLALLRIARQLGEGRGRDVALLFLAFLSTGAIALFFGHIEAYTIPCVLMLWYFTTAIRVVQTGEGFLTACVLLVAACLIHMEMLVLFPSLFFLLLPMALRSGWSHSVRKFLIALPLTFIPIVFVQWLCRRFPPPYPQYFGGSDGAMFVLLRAPPNAPNAVTLLSPVHLINTWNVYLLAGTAAAALLIGGVILFPKRVVRDPLVVFFVLATVGWFILTELWNVDNGAWGDWDLFMGFGFPLTIGGALMALRYLPSVMAQRALIVMAAAQWAHTVPFVAYNHLQH